jgi:formate/nitrite transporter
MRETVPARLDMLLPAEMAVRAEEIGVKKANLDGQSMFVLAVLGGAFIALGAIFATTVSAGAAGAMPYGFSRLLAGTAFSLGLILVVVGGAELFTGNNLIVMAWASGKITTALLIRNWLIVYAGNFLGAFATAMLVFLSGHYMFGNGAIGRTALATAQAKTNLGFGEAVVLGILANGLVCLAIWLSYSGRSTADKVLAIVPPIAAFVAAGFEHSIANMYFISVALLIQAGAPDSFWTALQQSPGDYAGLTWAGFLLSNLIPVTLGNILGGSVLVGVVYWFVYLRKSRMDQ